jgi:hypothetical protein
MNVVSEAILDPEGRRRRSRLSATLQSGRKDTDKV